MDILENASEKMSFTEVENVFDNLFTARTYDPDLSRNGNKFLS